MQSLLDTILHLESYKILAFILLGVAIWAGIRSVTSGYSKGWLVFMGVALGGSFMLFLLGRFTKKLRADVEKIQQERNQLDDFIEKQKAELAKQQADTAEKQRQLDILAAAAQRSSEEKARTGQELEETINELTRKYGL
ncbi:MAG: hypothetical protein OEZ39_15165 [Gammaproteobacteria bacterium]|nr:hypothetical protein [Gammaproteobacteria bacterium]MDH5653194.1 hypothetical protein [Gammaproteobacteria bacterium]